MTMESPIAKDYPYRFPAPAKLNLFLKILGRDASDYHQLQTVFQFLDYSDDLYFRLRNDSEIMLAPAMSNIPQAENLIWKAASLLRRRATAEQRGFSEQGVDIFLDKKLPIGGGIGGGSSNAATTLLVLNTLWQCAYPEVQLAEMALQLGADVPVFVKGKTAWAEGRGEHLQSIDIAEPWYLVIQPDCEVSTAGIFRHQELTRDSSPITIRAFLRVASPHFAAEIPLKMPLVHDQKSQQTPSGKRVQDLVKSYLQIGNDCESLVKKLYPEVSVALEQLNQFAPAQLTGTGACVFAAFENRKSAEQAQAVLQSLNVFRRVFVAKGCNSSPLHEALKTQFT